MTKKTEAKTSKGEMVYYYDDNEHMRRGVVQNVRKDEQVVIKDSFNGGDVRVAYHNVVPLTDNQKQFVKDARDQGKEIKWDYSGRFMYGKRCPSVNVDSPAELNTQAQIEWDQMGLGYVIYARH